MPIIYIGRHPETDDDVAADDSQRIVKGRTHPSHLSERGMLQAYYIAQMLGEAGVKSVDYSPSIRTTELSTIINHFIPGEVNFRTEPALLERDFGPLTGVMYRSLADACARRGKSVMELLLYESDFHTIAKKLQSSPVDTAAGESFKQLVDREFEFAQRLITTHNIFDNIYLATHRVVGNILLWALHLYCLSTQNLDAVKDEKYHKYHYPFVDLDFGAVHILQVNKQDDSRDFIFIKALNQKDHLKPMEYDLTKRKVPAPSKEDRTLLDELKAITAKGITTSNRDPSLFT